MRVSLQVARTPNYGAAAKKAVKAAWKKVGINLETLVKTQASSRRLVSSDRSPGATSEDYPITIDDGHGDVTVVRDQSTLTAESKALVAYLEKCAKPASLK